LNASSAFRIKPAKIKAAAKKVSVDGKKRSWHNKKPVVIRISHATLGGLSQVFKQLGDESRLKILLALAQEGELHVSALCHLLRQTQPAVSHHLTLLRMSGLVGFRRQGKNNFYRIESGLVRGLLDQFFAENRNSQRAFQFKDFSLVYKRK
jgi:ArsR family transcriptional regulator